MCDKVDTDVAVNDETFLKFCSMFNNMMFETGGLEEDMETAINAEVAENDVDILNDEIDGIEASVFESSAAMNINKVGDNGIGNSPSSGLTVRMIQREEIDSTNRHPTLRQLQLYKQRKKVEYSRGAANKKMEYRRSRTSVEDERRRLGQCRVRNANNSAYYHTTAYDFVGGENVYGGRYGSTVWYVPNYALTAQQEHRLVNDLGFSRSGRERNNCKISNAPSSHAFNKRRKPIDY